LSLRRFWQEVSTQDRGVSAILIALSMVVLLGFVALAIDATGLGFNERRQAQSAADVGSLAAVQFAGPQDIGNSACNSLSGLDRSRCNGAAEAMEVANATLDDPGLALWGDASKCSTPPPGFTVSPITECVAFNSNLQRAWVRIPSLEQPTTIARSIGIDSISVSAEAIAGASNAAGGAVLPFLLPGDAAGADYNCLKTGPNPNFGACEDLPVTGNFGSMDFFLYGDVDLDYTQKCSGDTNGRLVANIARGVDHPLGLHPSGIGGGILESSWCPDSGARPDMAGGQPGVGSALEDGLLYGGSSYSPTPYPGRIEDPAGYLVRDGGGPIAAAKIDDTPLWSYLASNSIADCDPGEVDTPAEMEVCIASAKDAGVVVFDNDLATATRMGWTPAVWENDFLTPGQPYHIKGYVPVYLDTTMFGCNASSCSTIHTPGVSDTGACVSNPVEPRTTCGTPGSKHSGLQGITAYILSREIVPANAQNPGPGDVNQRTFNLSE
jgi:Flp pilus assembly protein TadG